MLKFVVLAVVVYLAYRFVFRQPALPSSRSANDVSDDDMFVEYEEVKDD